MGPLTLSLIVVCVAVAFFSQLGKNHAFLDPLFITSLSNWTPWTQPLAEIRHGEIWRLITPIFIHFGPAHLIFNMLAMLDLGSMVEARQGSIRLALLVLVTGIISNLAQFYFDVWFSLSSFTFHFGPGMPSFGGISGVAYALLGYIWMKSKFDPGSGYVLQSQAVMMMLVWFFLCLAHIIPGIANTAHAGGLVVGMAWGYLSSLPAKRRRT